MFCQSDGRYGTEGRCFVTSISLDLQAAALSDADTVLREKGRSFYWARALLKREHAERATRLYSLCRYLDDLADEGTSSVVARAALDEVRSALMRGHSAHPVVQDGLRLIEACDIDPRVVCQLIDGVSSDLGAVEMVDLDALLRYCYQVAGTVGLMMSKVLEAHQCAALPHAVDLGIAMQLTNICRDVQADALVGRRYLPASMVGAIPAAALVNPARDIQPQLQACVGELLQLAERYYRSAELGLCYLPAGARAGILTAARIYREIGLGLARRHYQYWQGRVVVSPARKVVVTTNLLLRALLRPSLWRATQAHESTLHHPFSALLKSDCSVTARHGK